MGKIRRLFKRMRQRLSAGRRSRASASPTVTESFTQSTASDLKIEQILGKAGLCSGSTSPTMLARAQARRRGHAPGTPALPARAVKAVYNTGSRSGTSCKGRPMVRVRSYLLTVDDAVKVRDLTFPTYVDTFVWLGDTYDLDDNALEYLCDCGWTFKGDYMIRMEKVLP